MNIYEIKTQLIEFRKKHHLTQQNVSELTNIPQTTISLIERGMKLPLIFEERLLLDLLAGKNEKAQTMFKNKKVGMNLKQILRFNGYTESGFARLTGVTKREILDIENGMIDLEAEENAGLLRKITTPGIVSRTDLFRSDKVYGDLADEKIRDIKVEIDEEENRFVERIAQKVVDKLNSKNNNNSAFKDKDLNNTLISTLYNGLNCLSTTDQEKVEKWIDMYLR